MSRSAFYNCLLLLCLLFMATVSKGQSRRLTALKVSENHRFFADAKGKPFFWLGDTGWLLFLQLKREEADQYLEDRRKKGFNVIQVAIIYDVLQVNAYGDTALVNGNLAVPNTTPGDDFSDAAQYDFWDHVDYIIDKAAQKGLYLAMAPVWGTNVKNGWVTSGQAKVYATWLAERYRNKPNIIWLNGGDATGTDSTQVWKTMGNTLHTEDPHHLITFHPFQGGQSSDWFQKEAWLGFNMVQSGQWRYNQDTTGKKYGEDYWKYITADYKKKPVKPTLDGAPAYEGIAQNVHDPLQPVWTDSDVRRCAYWSVFAGAAGFTYGNSAVMQFHHAGDPKPGADGATTSWSDALQAPGAAQMNYLKKLLLSKNYNDHLPDPSLVEGSSGEKYDYLAAMRGRSYAFVYTCNGRTFTVRLNKTEGNKVKASWFNPKNGTTTDIGVFPNKGQRTFDPPGEPQNGNDWVLVLEQK